MGFLHPETLSFYPDLAANCTSPPMSAPTPGDVKPKHFLSTGQQQLPPYRRRSKSLERGLQTKELVSPTCQQAWSDTTFTLILVKAVIMLYGFCHGTYGIPT